MRISDWSSDVCSSDLSLRIFIISSSSSPSLSVLCARLHLYQVESPLPPARRIPNRIHSLRCSIQAPAESDAPLRVSQSSLDINLLVNFTLKLRHAGGMCVLYIAANYMTQSWERQ